MVKELLLNLIESKEVKKLYKYIEEINKQKEQQSKYKNKIK